MGSNPHGLRVEHLDEPLGICVAQPRLSWRLPDGTAEQRAYRITADTGWDTGRVDGGECLLIPYSGPGLTSGQRVRWRVKVWTDGGESDWSSRCWFETGLLERDDWQVEWIEPGAEPAGEAGNRPAPVWLVRERPPLRDSDFLAPADQSRTRMAHR